MYLCAGSVTTSHQRNINQIIPGKISRHWFNTCEYVVMSFQYLCHRHTHTQGSGAHDFHFHRRGAKPI